MLQVLEQKMLEIIGVSIAMLPFVSVQKIKNDFRPNLLVNVFQDQLNVVNKIFIAVRCLRKRFVEAI